MKGVYSQGNSRIGRKHSGYSRHARRIDAKHARGRARAHRGRSVVITISTTENTPEWRWFRSFEKKQGRTISKQARESLRKMVEEPDLDLTITTMRQVLECRIRELEYRDAEILELRHALGDHFAKSHPDCDACSEVIS